MDCQKSMNSFKIKNERLADYLLDNFFSYLILNNFSALL